MSFSVMKDIGGPDWPLGNIVVGTPGVPVGIMSLVDPNNVGDPNTNTASGVPEYTVRAQQILFQAFRAGVSHGLQGNTGNIYIVRQGVNGGTGNRDDLGAIVAVLQTGQTFVISPSPMVKDVYSPYRYSIDADFAGDGCQVTLLIF